MITLENETFKAEINPLGAEITDIIRKDDNREYIINDKTGKYWPRHAPILFPAIGKSVNDSYKLYDRILDMRLHGFARDYDFEIVAQTETTVKLVQHPTVESWYMFPYLYELTVEYKLTENGIEMGVTVKNNTDEAMPYSYGFHPGFKLQAPFDTYTLKVEGKGEVNELDLIEVGSNALRTGNVSKFTDIKDGEIKLNYSMLDNGSLTFNAKELSKVTLTSKDANHEVSLNLDDFPYLTIWTPEGKNEPFVCVEPFDGLGDKDGEVADWFKKDANTILETGDSKSYQLSISLD